MESPKPNGHTGQCMCCLNKTYLRHMWLPHNCKGEWLVYGQMLVDCFGIEWTQNVDDDSICQVCVSKLLVSVAFKKQVQESHATLQKNVPALSTEVLINSEISHEIEIPSEKIEIQILPDTEVPTIETDTEFSKEDEQEFTQELVKREKNENQLNITVSKYEVDSDAEPQENVNGCIRNFEDVEFLEEEVLEAEDDSEKGEERDDQEYVPVIKRPRMRMPANRRSQIYKQYTEEDLMKALEAVKSNKMNRLKASEVFNIPRKTISAKLFAERDDGADGKDQKSPEFSMEKLLSQHKENVMSILKYSNATPVKGHWGFGYACYFCPQLFQIPTELKQHTALTHKNLAIKVKSLTDHIVKLDITDLKCEICDVDIDSLDHLMTHIRDTHEIVLHLEIPNHIVPYRFDGDSLKCVKCFEQFDSFKDISEHMSDVHYRNYECTECHRGFVNLRSLKTHSIQHGIGVFICAKCPSYFNSREQLEDHEKDEHLRKIKKATLDFPSLTLKTESSKRELQIFNADKNQTESEYECSVCPKTFANISALNSHTNLIHGRVKLENKCKDCPKSFASVDALKSHVHLVHEKHKCYVCGRSHKSKFELKEHVQKEHLDGDWGDSLLIHSYQCSKCLKKFFSEDALQNHSLEHEETLEHCCEVCCSRFTEEESYMKHMKTEHGLE